MSLYKKSFTRCVPYPAPVLYWNHWDHEHLLHVHPDYTNAKILFETKDCTVLLTRTKIPYFPFLSNTQLNYIIRTGELSVIDYKKTFFGIISWAYIDIKPSTKNPEESDYKISYFFLLNGILKLIKFPLSIVLNIWNRKFLDEDLPIIKRRIKVLRSGFEDSKGLPKDLNERKEKEPLATTKVRLPVVRTPKSPMDDFESDMLGKSKCQVIKSMEIKRELNYPAHLVFWNHMDIEHTKYMHKGYVHEEILYEDERHIVFTTKFKLPVFSFIKLSSLEMAIRDGEHSFYNYSKTLFGIALWAHAEIEPNGEEKCHYKISYNLILGRFTKYLWPFLKVLLKKWNSDIWDEEIPMLERRLKVLKYGFRDNIGMPKNVKDRKYSEGKLSKFPFKRTYDVPYFNIHKQDD